MNPLLLAVLLLAPAPRAESFQALEARAAREERAGRDPAALEAYSSALSSWREEDGDAARAKAHCARAALRELGGDARGALADYSACLDGDPKNFKAWDRRGRLRLKAGRVEPAISDFYKAVALDMDYGPAYFDRARAYERQGDRVFAHEDYRRACELGVAAACPKSGRKKKPSASDKKRTESANEAVACRDAALVCGKAGAAYGNCIATAPTCSRASRKGCCPKDCARDMRKALDEGYGDAAAFRAVFAGSFCAAPAPARAPAAK